MTHSGVVRGYRAQLRRSPHAGEAKLTEVMHYGQSTTCRSGALVEYFRGARHRDNA